MNQENTDSQCIRSAELNELRLYKQCGCSCLLQCSCHWLDSMCQNIIELIQNTKKRSKRSRKRKHNNKLTCSAISFMCFGKPFADPESIDLNICIDKSLFLSLTFTCIAWKFYIFCLIGHLWPRKTTIKSIYISNQGFGPLFDLWRWQ